MGIFTRVGSKGNLEYKIKSTNPIAVGDKVTFELERTGDETTGVINSILDRKNYIIRKSVNLSKQTHIIAANLDVCYLLVTLENPITHPLFIDRFLVTAEAYGVPVSLLFNKWDAYDTETLERAKTWWNVIGASAITVWRFPPPTERT